jgi:hypothetical protein
MTRRKAATTPKTTGLLFDILIAPPETACVAAEAGKVQRTLLLEAKV